MRTWVMGEASELRAGRLIQEATELGRQVVRREGVGGFLARRFTEGEMEELAERAGRLSLEAGLLGREIELVVVGGGERLGEGKQPEGKGGY